ncbi:hypothetical protein ACLOJK_015394 [Asimina triloba]
MFIHVYHIDMGTKDVFFLLNVSRCDLASNISYTYGNKEATCFDLSRGRTGAGPLVPMMKDDIEYARVENLCNRYRVKIVCSKQEMEREKKKRGREEEKEADEEETRRRDFKEKAATRREFLAEGVGEDCEPLKLSDSFQPLGVFEFPWEEEETLVSESVWKSHDVFYSSLLEGCCSVVDDGPPCQIPAPEPEEESWPLEGEETDGVDCIWSCVLSQPLSAGATKLSSS